MVPQPLQLAVTTDARASATFHEVLDPCRVPLEDVFLVHEPTTRAGAGITASDLGVQFRLGREVGELLVTHHILVGIEIVLGPRTAVRDQQRRRVCRLRCFEQLDHIVVGRDDRHRVLDAGIPVHCVRHVEPVLESPFRSRHQPQLPRGHDEPLALPPISRHVHLERLGVVIVAVTTQHAPGMIQTVDAQTREHSGTGGVNARARDLTGFHPVGVNQDVGCRCLRVARRGNTVRKIDEVNPGTSPVQSPQVPHVCVCVNEPWYDRRATHVDHVGAVRRGSARADTRYAIVLDHDVRVLDHFVTAHRNDACAAEYDRTLRHVTRRFDRDPYFFRSICRVAHRGRIGTCSAQAVVHRLRLVQTICHKRVTD